MLCLDKDWLWIISTFGGCDALERIYFRQSLLCKGLVVFLGLIFYNFYLGRMWWSSEDLYLPVFILGEFSGLERTDSGQLVLWEGVVVLKELNFYNHHFWRLWWTWKDWLSLWKDMVILKDWFGWFPLWDSVLVFKGLTSYKFHFGRVWWSCQDWFFTFYNCGGYGCLARTNFG